jgi:hypothetical protein
MNTDKQTEPKGKAEPEMPRWVAKDRVMRKEWLKARTEGNAPRWRDPENDESADEKPKEGRLHSFEQMLKTHPPIDMLADEKHSPLPWTFSAIGGDNLIMSKGVPVAEVLYDEAQERISIEEMDANKAFIVRACNNAERLAEALRVLLSRAQDLDQSATDSGLRNCEALAKARGALAQWEAAQ